MAQKNTGHKSLDDLMSKMEPAVDPSTLTGTHPAWSFGHPLPDRATKIGGLPKGDIVEIFGNENCGKSLMTLRAIAEAQKQGAKCYVLLSENAYDESWMKKNGISLDPKLFKALLPGTLEEALEFCELAAEQKGIGIIMVDSLANFVAVEELEKSIYEEARVGGNSKKIKAGMRRIVNKMLLHHSEQTVVLINQLYEKVGGGQTPRGNTGGGKSVKYNAGMRIEFRKIQQVEGDVIDPKGNKVKQRVGDLIQINIMKSKVAPQNGITQFVLRDDVGLDVVSDVVDLAIENKIITGSGWYVIPTAYSHKDEDTKIQGKENIYKYYRANKEPFEALNDKVFEVINTKNGGNQLLNTDEEDDDDILDDAVPPTPKKKPGRQKRIKTPEATGIVDLGVE